MVINQKENDDKNNNMQTLDHGKQNINASAIQLAEEPITNNDSTDQFKIRNT